MAKKTIVTGLDIGSHVIKAVEMTAQGDSIEVTACAQIPRPKDEELSEGIDAFFTENKLHRKRVVVGTSGKNLITRYIAMPKMADEKIHAAVMAEADKYIPFEIDDVVIDSQKIAEEVGENEELQVLLVAIKRNVIEGFTTQLKNAKINANIIDADEFALGNIFEYASSDEDAAVATALVDIGFTKSCVNIMQGKKSLFTREFFNAGKQLTQAIVDGFDKSFEEAEMLKCEPGENKEIIDTVLMPVLEEMAGEVNLAIDFFENQYQSDLGSVYITGGSSFYPELDLMFSQGLQRPTATWNPFENKINIKTSNVDLETIKPLGAQYTVAMGLAVRECV